jgi:hypothetical protein
MTGRTLREKNRSRNGAPDAGFAACGVHRSCGLSLRLGLREDGKNRIVRGEEIHWWLKVEL